METLAAGRIALWEGGSLWGFDVPGEAGERNAMHAHHAFQLTFALGGAFTLHADARRARSNMARNGRWQALSNVIWTRTSR